MDVHRVLISHLLSRVGEHLLGKYAAAGAKAPHEVRNVLVLQHYPGLCAGLKQHFVQHAPAGEALDFRCSFGHTHDTKCEAGTDAQCEFAMNGGGGGCCANDVVNSQAGFGVLTFEPAGGMNIELMHLGRRCVFEPKGMSAAERKAADAHAHGTEHLASFAAAKLEANAFGPSDAAAADADRVAAGA